ncbi:hypothetical protein JOC69_003332 [Heliobacterium gestii]|nr:hypothetical protein [Heliomicrobium gestii]MBM7868414.1 hypothetical protein [Heliomicrobium gestii]
MVNSNRYSVPLGTYQAGVEVRIEIAEENLSIYALDIGAVLAEHGLVAGRGHLWMTYCSSATFTSAANSLHPSRNRGSSLSGISRTGAGFRRGLRVPCS